MRKRTAILAALSFAGFFVTAPAAHAALVTHCIGTGGAVTVPNDLHVPAGESCALDGTTVTGNVSVAAGGNLVVTGGTFSGNVRIAGNGYFDASDTDVAGTLVLAAGGYGVFLKDATSGAVTVRPKGATTVDSFLYAEDSTIAGTVNVQAGEVQVDRTSVEGNLSSTGTYYTDVHDSFVDGTLSVLNSATGSVVCGSSVRGKATFAGNLGGVQLGPNGALDSCASGGFWGRDVNVTSTSGGVTVDDNIIDGVLTVTGNTPAARIADTNRVRRGVVTDPAAAAARAAARPPVARPSPARGDDTVKAGARRAEAVQEARGAGPADL